MDFMVMLLSFHGAICAVGSRRNLRREGAPAAGPEAGPADAGSASAVRGEGAIGGEVGRLDAHLLQVGPPVEAEETDPSFRAGIEDAGDGVGSCGPDGEGLFDSCGERTHPRPVARGGRSDCDANPSVTRPDRWSLRRA